MAKLKGPLHSIDARGKGPGGLVFSKNNSNNFAYFGPIIKRNTVSPFQTASYLCSFNALSYIWINVLTDSQRLNWENAEGNASAFMKFFIYNKDSIALNGEVWDSPTPPQTIVEDIRINPDIFWIEERDFKHIFPVAQTWDEPLNMKGHYRLYKFYFDLIPRSFPPGDPVPPEYLTDPTLLEEMECPCTNFIIKDGYSGFYNESESRKIWPSDKYGLYQFEAFTSTSNSCDINYYYYFDPVTRGIFWGTYG